MQFWVMTNWMHSFLMYLLTCIYVPVKDRHVRHSPECVIPDDVLIQFGPPDDEHLLLETCRGISKYIRKECIKLVITHIYTF
jgi:hypothetical protein